LGDEQRINADFFEKLLNLYERYQSLAGGLDAAFSFVQLAHLGVLAEKVLEEVLVSEH
jgi:hypothetical protein